MGRNSAVSREARQYIVQQVQEKGVVTVGGVAEIVRQYYQFDPHQSFRQDVSDTPGGFWQPKRIVTGTAP